MDRVPMAQKALFRLFSTYTSGGEGCRPLVLRLRVDILLSSLLRRP